MLDVNALWKKNVNKKNELELQYGKSIYLIQVLVADPGFQKRVGPQFFFVFFSIILFLFLLF